ncbi:hypothetical protein JCM5353_007026 [Sporobolomyces roseus]
MDNASLAPPSRFQSSNSSSTTSHHHSSRSPSPSLTSSTRTSTRPSPSSSSSLVRPAPARKGQPASLRNFAASSAGGATSHLSERTGGQANQRRESQGRYHERDKANHVKLTEEQRNKLDQWGDSFIPSEETIRNDYSCEYVQTGKRPQNFLRNTAVESRFSEYPKLASLLEQKHSLTCSTRYSIPPTYLNLAYLPLVPSIDSQEEETSSSPTSLISQALSTLQPSRFDCILLTPPASTPFSELLSLNLGSLAANPGFVWLWVGSGQARLDGKEGTDGIGLEKGRELLASWGYRRCEDIVWLRTNKGDPEGDLTKEPTSLFTPTIEHCLMGIRGTVRRSTDSWFVHCNVDTDVIVWEGDQEDPDLKPPELQSLIENFCLGTRRLHLYGSKNALRRGWLTVSGEGSEFGKESKVQEVEKEESRWEAKEWDRESWEARWRKTGEQGDEEPEGGAGGSEKVATLLPYIEELDALRPKSPPPRNGLPSSGGLGRGRGAGLGITRSGLVTQSVARGATIPIPPPPVSSNGYSTPPRNVSNGMGRGRGNSLPPKPTNSMNGFSFPPPPPPQNAMPFPSPSHSSLSSSTNSSPYRIHHPSQLAPPIPHSLPSRPSFHSQQSSASSYSAQSSPRGLSQSQRHSSREQPRYSQPPMNQPNFHSQPPPPPPHNGQPSPFPPQQMQQHFFQPPLQSQLQMQGQPRFAAQTQQMYLSPTPEQFYHAQQQQLYFQQQQQQQQEQAQSNFAPPPPPPPPPQFQTQFSALSLSPHPNPYAYSHHISPNPSPSIASMHLPHSQSNPYLGLEHSPSMSSLHSSSNGGLSLYSGPGDGGELEYPIGGPSRRASERGGIYEDA